MTTETVRLWWPGPYNPDWFVGVVVTMDSDTGELRVRVGNLKALEREQEVWSIQRDWLKEPRSGAPSNPPFASGAAAPGS